MATAIVVTAGVSAVGFYWYATHDRIELLDSTVVYEAGEAGCRAVVQALEEPAASRSVRIRKGNEAIDDLVADVASLGRTKLQQDLPAEDWLADWRSLARARGDFAERLTADPGAHFEVPKTDDGYPITERLVWAAGPHCERAVALSSAP